MAAADSEIKCAVGLLIGNVIVYSIMGGIRSCSNKQDLTKYYNESSEKTSMALIMDGNLFRYDNLQDVHFMPNDSYKNYKVNSEFDEYVVTKSFGDDSITVTTTKVVEYDIEWLNSKTMIIYTYSDNQARRNAARDYILSNIKLDENNNIILNKNDLTQEGFEMYVSTINNEKPVFEAEATQRTRSLVEN